MHFSSFQKVACGVCIAVILLSSKVLANSNESSLWDSLRKPNHFVLIRHAMAPGIGDPPNFDVNMRETQRNLSEAGIEQAKKMGKLFHEHGIKDAKVFSSQWFRCKDTAQLLELGPVTELPFLNSLFPNMEKRERQTKALNDWLLQLDMNKPVIIVTHNVNISAFTGYSTASGEIVFMKKTDGNKFEKLGSIVE